MRNQSKGKKSFFQLISIPLPADLYLTRITSSMLILFELSES